MKAIKLLSYILLIILSVNLSFACFDTYLFLNGKSMVYPTSKLVTELTGEYSFVKLSDPTADTFFAVINAYYGVSDKFSVQLGISSPEVTRDQTFSFQEIGGRAVFNVLSGNVGENTYYLDTILECRGNVVLKEISGEISVPNIWYFGNFIGVIHPVLSLSLYESFDYQFGGHMGLFYKIGGSSIVGFGTEYMSAQSSSVLGNRLVEGEWACSLFFGSRIGDNIYLQNEIAKGLMNSRDFGFALTVKTIF